VAGREAEEGEMKQPRKSDAERQREMTFYPIAVIVPLAALLALVSAERYF
jgi:hypothetical protein